MRRGEGVRDAWEREERRRKMERKDRKKERRRREERGRSNYVITFETDWVAVYKRRGEVIPWRRHV